MRPLLLVALLAVSSGTPALAAWSPLGNPLSNMPGYQIGPVMARGGWSGPAGPEVLGMLVVWTDTRADLGDLYCAVVTDLPPADPAPGTDGQALVVSPGTQREPAVSAVHSTLIGAQPLGTAFVVAWTDGVLPGQVRALRLGDLDWGATGVPVHDVGATGGASAAVAVQSGGFGAIVAWTETAVGVRATRVQLLDELGARQWGANGTPLGTDTTVSDVPRIAAGFGGSAYVLRSDRRNGTLPVTERALALFRVEPDGSPTPGWPAEGLVLGSTGALSYLLLADGNGGAYVVWNQAVALSDASPGIEVRATRILADGSAAAGWSVAGSPVVSRPDGRVRIGHADLDASGGLALALGYEPVVGGPPASGQDLVAQRLLPDGQRPAGWPAAGLALCSAPDWQYGVQVIGTSDGLLAVWQDDRGATTDLYGARLLLDGTTAEGWTPGGSLLCGAPSDQGPPVLAPASGGGAVFAWSDERDFGATQADMFAQTVNPIGQVSVPPVAPRGLSLSAPWPQPASRLARLTLTGPPGEAEVEVLDTQGRVVAGWRMQSAGGATSVDWDLADRSGRRVAPGVYHLRVRLGGAALARRVVVVH